MTPRKRQIIIKMKSVHSLAPTGAFYIIFSFSLDGLSATVVDRRSWVQIPGSSHTKDFKNGSDGFPPWCSGLKG